MNTVSPVHNESVECETLALIVCESPALKEGNTGQADSADEFLCLYVR